MVRKTGLGAGSAVPGLNRPVRSGLPYTAVAMDVEDTRKRGRPEDDHGSLKKSKTDNQAKEHIEQLQRLQQKDPEFYEFLKEHDKELLQFDDDDGDDNDEEFDTDLEDGNLLLDEEAKKLGFPEKEQGSLRKALTTAEVESWCKSVQDNGSLSAVRSLMKAFRTACHYGDDGGGESTPKLNIMSSSVFNKIMLFVLNEMDGILRSLLKLPSSGGKKETVKDLMATKLWKNHSHLVKSYLGNALHVLNQMTDTEMISFTLRRLKFSSLFLAAFPTLLRKYIKVALHFWGTGGGALPIVSFLFLRDLCIRIGSDCTDNIFRGIYKAYILNCQFVNTVKLRHIHFLRNCVIELLGVDLATAYQQAFVFIRQLAMILRDALNTKTKEAFRKVYEWKFMNCLELWTGAICAYNSESELKQLAYPLTQIISGVARLVPTAQYFPLRLRCINMLNRISASTNSFIPVSILLLDMLEMKELNRPPTGGVGKAVDLRSILKVSKPSLKTRAFQESCVTSVVEELAEHLAQWSYSVAFMELSFIPLVRLRSFCKSTKVERFRREMRLLIRQIEANSDFVNGKRMTVSFLPNEPAAASFLQDEKEAGVSPLSKYVVTLHQRAETKNASLTDSSVLVGEESSVFGRKIPESDEEEDDDARKNEEGASVFSSSWLPGKGSKVKHPTETKKKKGKLQKQRATDEDVVEDLVLSSDEDDDDFPNESLSEGDDKDEVPPKQKSKKQKTKRSKQKKSRGKSRNS